MSAGFRLAETPDLVIAGGTLCDPASGLSGELDIAIRRKQIVAIEKALSESYPGRVIDVQGALVLPGLVDLHTHCFWDGTYFGIRPDPVAGRTGVTTWVDAGSAGAWNLAAFRTLAETS